ncbi:MAG: biotin synthase BioB [Bacteroidetes bacterium]|nr:MAG: biotin synthase BioB [Bacteroidota bacterium]
MEIRYNWTLEEILEVYNRPLIDLIYEAASIHRKYHNPKEVQISSLLSVKTGGCTEDCGYCPQSAKYNTGINAHGMLSVEEVKKAAENAKSNGASRMCLGAAWREVRDNKDFDTILEMVKTITDMDMEVCCTLGMLTEEQAQKLADAGLYAYNHNIDTSADHYETIISTRKYEDRINTIHNVRKANVTVCSGGIIGMGESVEDRAKMLLTLANMNPHPESVPINTLVAVEGTPLENQKPVDSWELVRMIATTRIVLPKSAVRLSAGRKGRTLEAQALCFLAGANSIFSGDKLLTTPNQEFNEDMMLFEALGIQPKKPFSEKNKPEPKIDIEQIKKEREAKNKGFKPRSVTYSESLK